MQKTVGMEQHLRNHVILNLSIQPSGRLLARTEEKTFSEIQKLNLNFANISKTIYFEEATWVA